MPSLSNFKIGTRLALAFGLLLVLLLGMAGLAVKQTGTIYGALDYYTVNTTPSLQAVRSWQEATDNIRMQQAKHIMANTEAQMSTLEASIGQAAERLKGNVAAYEKLLSNDEDKRLWQDVVATTNAFLVSWDRLKAISRLTPTDPSKAEEASSFFAGESESRYKASAAAIDKEWEFNVALARQLAADGATTYKSALTVIAVACVLAVIVGITAALLITASITRPIQQAVEVAERVAGGDLTSDIVVIGEDEAAQLLRALARMNNSLVQIVSAVREGSDSIATGSSQIASGNADLSQRTEEQASSLEQTAASMEQLTENVRINSNTASAANALANNASVSATKGGEVVGLVVATMQDIAASSKRIADIIGVIDGIAFQTNILALNAAVEAARAGEQGRGFAVVAGEVRSLAQRAANAAKEIKTLIGDSVGKVETGARQVQDAGQSMDEIVAQVQRVGQLISDISSASAEQTTGITEIGSAVGQLDQVTQRNAALVEESAAAAEGLRRQATRLAEVVSVFKLSQQQAQATIARVQTQDPRLIATAARTTLPAHRAPLLTSEQR